MREVVESVESEFQRYRKLGEGTFGQVEDADLGRAASRAARRAGRICWQAGMRAGRPSLTLWGRSRTATSAER